MPRYFLELGYKGTAYSGFQVQENARTIQSAVEAALHTLFRQPFSLTGSSRTDTGVHALQNFFHFDTELPLRKEQIYNLNAILPQDIAARAWYRVANDAHCRFGAISRHYKYYIYRHKDPFLFDRAWHYPYKMSEDQLHAMAELVEGQHDFRAFSKRNTQVKQFGCTVELSRWGYENNCLVYEVKANRFLRGMVRALVSSMLKVARGSMDVKKFRGLLEGGEQSAADFSAPAQGLFLVEVAYPEGYLSPVN